MRKPAGATTAPAGFLVHFVISKCCRIFELVVQMNT